MGGDKTLSTTAAAAGHGPPRFASPRLAETTVLYQDLKFVEPA